MTRDVPLNTRRFLMLRRISPPHDTHCQPPHLGTVVPLLALVDSCYFSKLRCCALVKHCGRCARPFLLLPSRFSRQGATARGVEREQQQGAQVLRAKGRAGAVDEKDVARHEGPREGVRRVRRAQPRARALVEEGRVGAELQQQGQQVGAGHTVALEEGLQLLALALVRGEVVVHDLRDRVEEEPELVLVLRDCADHAVGHHAHLTKVVDRGLTVVVVQAHLVAHSIGVGRVQGDDPHREQQAREAQQRMHTIEQLHGARRAHAALALLVEVDQALQRLGILTPCNVVVDAPPLPCQPEARALEQQEHERGVVHLGVVPAGAVPRHCRLELEL